MNEKRKKILKRREFLRKQRKQEDADKQESSKRFAESNPSPKLQKLRTVRFRKKVQEVEQIPSIIAGPGMTPELIERLQARYDVWTQDPKVMEAVNRRREWKSRNI
ncbi:hypothetical protein EBR03_08735 [bacterium]|nr:hypothetical protein [bacterium]